MGQICKRMVMIVSLKGGVGKTTAARAAVSILRAEGLKVAAFDADGAVGGLLKSLGQRDDSGRLLPDQDRLLGVGYYDIRDDNQRCLLINCVAEEDDLIIQDTAGGSLIDCCRVVDGGGPDMSGLLDVLDARGYRLTVIHMISNLLESAASVGSWMNALSPDRCDHIAVLNQHFGRTTGDFPWWTGFVDNSSVQRGGANRRRLLESGGMEIVLPALPPATFAKLDALHLSPTAAGSSSLLTVAEQAHAARFVRDFKVELRKVGHLLGREPKP